MAAETLPAVTLPRSLPCWLAAGHTMEAQPVYATVAMRTGHTRKRRVYRSPAPRIVTVAMFLDAGQGPVFFDWYENRIRAGADEFSTRVPNQGPGLRWFAARFYEPPTYEALPLNRFRLTAKLLLTGTGSANPPPDAAMVARSVVALAGSAAITVPKQLAAASRVELVPAIRLRAVSAVALSGGVSLTVATPLDARSVVALLAAAPVTVPGGVMLREDGSRVMREDGSRILRES